MNIQSTSLNTAIQNFTNSISQDGNELLDQMKKNDAKEAQGE